MHPSWKGPAAVGLGLCVAFESWVSSRPIQTGQLQPERAPIVRYELAEPQAGLHIEVETPDRLLRPAAPLAASGWIAPFPVTPWHWPSGVVLSGLGGGEPLMRSWLSGTPSFVPSAYVLPPLG
jgi:hypothetical protein